jgi:hypothetical protein
MDQIVPKWEAMYSQLNLKEAVTKRPAFLTKLAAAHGQASRLVP